MAKNKRSPNPPQANNNGYAGGNGNGFGSGPSNYKNGQPGPRKYNNGQPGPSNYNNGQPGPINYTNGQPGPSKYNNGQPGPSKYNNWGNQGGNRNHNGGNQGGYRNNNGGNQGGNRDNNWGKQGGERNNNGSGNRNGLKHHRSEEQPDVYTNGHQLSFDSVSGWAPQQADTQAGQYSQPTYRGFTPFMGEGLSNDPLLSCWINSLQAAFRPRQLQETNEADSKTILHYLFILENHPIWIGHDMFSQDMASPHLENGTAPQMVDYITAIFYTYNTFNINSIEELEDMGQRIPESSRLFVRHLMLGPELLRVGPHHTLDQNGHTEKDIRLITALKKFPELAKLTYCWDWDFNISRHEIAGQLACSFEQFEELFIKLPNDDSGAVRVGLLAVGEQKNMVRKTLYYVKRYLDSRMHDRVMQMDWSCP